jgi:hypothetical protein
MKPGSHTRIPTVFEVVRDAAAITDPAGEETAVRELFEAFEDDDRPTPAVEHLLGDLMQTARGIDPEGDDPAVFATAAVAAWLAKHPGQVHDGEHVLREGVRLAFHGHPPPSLAQWLEERGVEV